MCVCVCVCVCVYAKVGCTSFLQVTYVEIQLQHSVQVHCGAASEAAVPAPLVVVAAATKLDVVTIGVTGATGTAVAVAAASATVVGAACTAAVVVAAFDKDHHSGRISASPHPPLSP